jgi:hypothetical protein
MGVLNELDCRTRLPGCVNGWCRFVTFGTVVSVVSSLPHRATTWGFTTRASRQWSGLLVGADRDGNDDSVEYVRRGPPHRSGSFDSVRLPQQVDTRLFRYGGVERSRRGSGPKRVETEVRGPWERGCTPTERRTGGEIPFAVLFYNQLRCRCLRTLDNSSRRFEGRVDAQVVPRKPYAAIQMGVAVCTCRARLSPRPIATDSAGSDGGCPRFGVGDGAAPADSPLD